MTTTHLVRIGIEALGRADAGHTLDPEELHAAIVKWNVLGLLDAHPHPLTNRSVREFVSTPSAVEDLEEALARADNAIERVARVCERDLVGENGGSRR
jgi:hypothetical protein